MHLQLLKNCRIFIRLFFIRQLVVAENKAIIMKSKANLKHLPQTIDASSYSHKR